MRVLEDLAQSPGGTEKGGFRGKGAMGRMRARGGWTMNLWCGPASTGVSIARGVLSLKDRAKTMTVRASKSRFCLVRVEGAEGSGKTYELPGPGR